MSLILLLLDKIYMSVLIKTYQPINYSNHHIGLSFRYISIGLWVEARDYFNPNTSDP